MSRMCLASLAKWLSVRLRTKWLWARVTLQSLDIDKVLEEEYVPLFYRYAKANNKYMKDCDKNKE